MSTPLFNYSSQLLSQVAQAGVLYTDSSILSLNCASGAKTSEQQRALDNFEHWKLIFMDNCDAVFYTGSSGQISANEKKYKADLLAALLIAELYDYTYYTAIERIDSSAVFKWENGLLCKSRPLSRLL